jgi:hypothetical protein
MAGVRGFCDMTKDKFEFSDKFLTFMEASQPCTNWQKPGCFTCQKGAWHFYSGQIFITVFFYPRYPDYYPRQSGVDSAIL